MAIAAYSRWRRCLTTRWPASSRRMVVRSLINQMRPAAWKSTCAPFLKSTTQRQVSSAGGVQPRWSHDGRELFFVSPDGYMTAARIHAIGDSLRGGYTGTSIRRATRERREYRSGCRYTTPVQRRCRRTIPYERVDSTGTSNYDRRQLEGRVDKMTLSSASIRTHRRAYQFSHSNPAEQILRGAKRSRASAQP